MNSPLPPPSARLMFSMSPPPPSCTTSLPTLAVWPVRSNVAQSTHDVPSVSTPSWRRSRQQLMPTKRYRLEKKTFCFFYSIHAVSFRFQNFEKIKIPKKLPRQIEVVRTTLLQEVHFWCELTFPCYVFLLASQASPHHGFLSAQKVFIAFLCSIVIKCSILLNLGYSDPVCRGFSDGHFKLDHRNMCLLNNHISTIMHK